MRSEQLAKSVGRWGRRKRSKMVPQRGSSQPGFRLKFQGQKSIVQDTQPNEPGNFHFARSSPQGSFWSQTSCQPLSLALSPAPDKILSAEEGRDGILRRPWYWQSLQASIACGVSYSAVLETESLFQGKLGWGGGAGNGMQYGGA